MRILLPLIWAGAIFLGSCLPGASVNQATVADFILHKAVHLLEYGIFAVLLVRAFGGQPLRGRRLRGEGLALLVLAICFLYGLSDEWHQSFTPGRESRLRDAFIDLTGASLGLIALWKLSPPARKKLFS